MNTSLLLTILILAAAHLLLYLEVERRLRAERRRRRRLLEAVPEGGTVLGMVVWQGTEVLVFRGRDGALGAAGTTSQDMERACVRWVEAEDLAPEPPECAG